MRSFAALIALLGLAATAPVAAQANPFKLSMRGLPAYTVDYTLSGDMTGTGRSTAGGDRMASTQTTTGKFFGKTSTSSTWSMTDPEVLWTADLSKKQGTKMVNPLPMMAEAYDDLDGPSKARFHDNMQSMITVIARALPGVPLEGEKKGSKTIAGEQCDVTEMGAFSFCTMTSTPIVLQSMGSMFCVNYEQTATAVSRSTDASLFDAPAGIKWSEELNRAQADSSARSWIKQLASKELADSLAKARAEYRAAEANGEPQMTPEQQKELCDALKNFDLGKAMKNAFKDAMGDAVKGGIKSGLRGLIRKP